jgi:hypothetical protein
MDLSPFFPTVLETENAPPCSMSACSWYRMGLSEDGKVWICPKCKYADPCDLREINLDDILLALQGKDGTLYAVTETGGLIAYHSYPLVFQQTEVRWRLGRSLSDQSPELKLFLWSLLFTDSN